MAVSELAEIADVTRRAAAASPRRSGGVPVSSVADDLIRDAALERASEDRFNHDAIVGVVADMATAAKPPVNIALYGAWGSGKSSFFAALEDVITTRDKSVRVARYDAWKYGGRALKLNFIQSVAEQLDIDAAEFGDGLARDRDEVRLDLTSFIRRNWKSLLLGLGVAVLVALIWYAIVTFAAWAVDRDAGLDAALRVGMAGVGGVLSIALAALLIGPKVLESAVIKTTTPAPDTDDQFAKRFEKLVARATRGKAGRRLVVFIDELDRCSPDDVVATLVDLKTFLDVGRCVFIVGADREVLEAALRRVPQATPVREDDPYYSTPGAFLDKIFQHQVSLPPLRPQALTKFARELLMDHGGIWRELREAKADDQLFHEVVYALVPVHVRSPRRVKILLNHYATTVRIAQARGISWLDRASEFAVFSVLQIEFPHLAADLAKTPLLLDYLRGRPVPDGAEALARLVESYRGPSTGEQHEAADVAQPAGALLDTGDDDDEAKERANRVLNTQLHSYLAKVAAQGVPDPRPDLFFLQSAGTVHGIDDPALGDTIDLAADLSPDEVVQAFAGQPSTLVATAVQLLARQAENELGPGHQAIVESICRLIEELDHDDILQVAAAAAPVVLAAIASKDLRDGAIPGALTLGTVTGNTDLVQSLLAVERADEFATKGLLGRLANVLAFAARDEARLIHGMLAQAYAAHPAPLHDALSQLPLDVAEQLWEAVAEDVGEALVALESSAEAATQPAPAASRTGKVGATEAVAAAVRSPETSAQRYEDLLTAAEARSDDAQQLISAILAFGQQQELAPVREAVRDREDDALDRISDPILLTKHALLGMARAPIGDCAWWAEQATADVADRDLASAAIERLIGALPSASVAVAPEIAKAGEVAIGCLVGHSVATAVEQLAAAISSLAWGTDEDDARRAAAHRLAAALRSEVDGTKLDELVAQDLADGLGAGAADAGTTQVLGRIAELPPGAARALDAMLGNGEAPAAGDALTLRARLVARSRYEGSPLPLAEIGGALALDDGNLVLDAWLALNPDIDDVITALGLASADTNRLAEYAGSQTLPDRTTLWIHLEESGANVGVLRRVGSAGIGEDAVQHVATKITQATAQAERDNLVNRLVSANVADPAARKAGADIVVHLLTTGVLGDGPLAARTALALGEPPRGTLTQMRDAFDEYVARSGQRLTQTQAAELRARRLLSTPRRRRVGGRVKNLAGR